MTVNYTQYVKGAPNMIVIYQSNTGYTEQYAKMLARRLDVPAYPLEKVPKCHLHKEACSSAGSSPATSSLQKAAKITACAPSAAWA